MASLDRVLGVSQSYDDEALDTVLPQLQIQVGVGEPLLASATLLSRSHTFPPSEMK
jgi:hypothetical protein